MLSLLWKQKRTKHNTYINTQVKSQEGGGGNSTLILVQLCRRYFSDPPYARIPDFRIVYLFMYDLYIC